MHFAVFSLSRGLLVVCHSLLYEVMVSERMLEVFQFDQAV